MKTGLGSFLQLHGLLLLAEVTLVSLLVFKCQSFWRPYPWVIPELGSDRRSFGAVEPNGVLSTWWAEGTIWSEA